MKNQQGFFTIIGLCFLLAVTICVINIQESSRIFTSSATDFQAEQELQNIADSAILEAIEIIPRNENYLEKMNMQKVQNLSILNREDRQYKISEISKNKNSDRLKNLNVEVFFEFGKIHHELGQESDADFSDVDDCEGIIFIAVASADSRFDDKKIYRSSSAFIEFEKRNDENVNYSAEDFKIKKFSYIKNLN